jgi:plastocyanin
MRKIIQLSHMFIFTGFILFAVNSFAVKRIVSVSNFLFSPASVSANVGDTMRWVWVAGFHTTTSTIVPPGAATWDSPVTSSNQTFEYKITVAGSYTYFCKVHGLGMSGTITVAAAPPTLAVSPSNQNVTATPGSTSFTVTSTSAWTVSSNQTWCTVTLAGTGNGTIVASYTQNPLVTSRVASITTTVIGITPVVVTVTQAGAPAPEVTVITPNGGESYLQGSTQNITWSDNIAEDVKIDLYKGGAFLQQIVGSTPSTGSYSWIIAGAQQPGTDYKIRITSTTQGSVFDASDADFGIEANPPALVTLQNISIASGQTNCYDASQTITVAGSGTSFIVENGGNATLVAGQNIIYLPGTLVNSGGYMHGYITETGQYCNPVPAPTVSGIGNEGNLQTGVTNPAFKIYPNPTPGLFTLELNGAWVAAAVIVNIFSPLGESVLNATLDGETKHDLSLNGKPAGVYYIRLASGSRTETMKIVKL